MANLYIELYEGSKQKGATYVESIQGALDQLSLDCKAASQSASSLTGFFKGLFEQPLATLNDLEIIAEIRTQLDELKEEEGFNQRVIADILAKNRSDISPTSQTHTFIDYVYSNLMTIDFSMRPIAMPLVDSDEQVAEKHRWAAKLSQMLANKHLASDTFKQQPNGKLDFNSDISAHAQWVFNNIYRFPYPNAKQTPIPRYFHGIAHVSRVAINVQVWANLYRKYNVKEAKKLTPEDIKLLQIAALFHDSAREDDGVDKWDHESALFLYYYFTRVLGVDKTKAILIAEATANKDPHPEGYFEIIEQGPDNVTWRFNKTTAKNKNIYQKIIHDADCLDVMRAKPYFDARYLDFHKEVASTNTQAFEDMAQLITEARSVIAKQGDTYKNTKPEVKKRYEHDQAFQQIVTDIDPQQHPIMHALAHTLQSPAALAGKQFVPTIAYDKNKGLTQDNMRAAVREGLVFARGIADPSAQARYHENETLAEIELGITMSELGNPMRSISMIGYGSGVYSNAGFLLLEPNPDAISKVAAKDIDTGRGRAKQFKLASLQLSEPRPDAQQIKKELAALHHQLQLGGNCTETSSHVEVVCDITRYDAIYCSTDPNIYNPLTIDTPEAFHPNVPLLQAIYLQKLCERQYQTVQAKYVQTFGNPEGLAKCTSRFGASSVLPIFFYSGIHNQVKEVSAAELTDEKIVELWAGMCSTYLTKQLAGDCKLDLRSLTLDDIKTLSMYKSKSENYFAKSYAPADSSYSVALREKINARVTRVRAKVLEEYEEKLVDAINQGEDTVLSDKAFYAVLHNPQLLNCIKSKVIQTLTAEMQGVNEPEFIKTSKASRIYVLATKLAYKPVETVLFTKVAEQVTTCTVALHTALPATTSARVLKGQFDMVANCSSMLSDFGLATSYATALTTMRDAILSRMSLQYPTQGSFKIYGKMIAGFSSQGSVNLPLEPLLQAVHKDFQHAIEIKQDPSITKEDLSTYLDLAQCMHGEPKETIKAWLQQGSNSIFADDLALLTKINTLNPLDDNNLDLLDALVSKVSTRKSATEKANLMNWVNTLMVLQEIVEGHRFTSKQLEVIQNQWVKLCANYCNDASIRPFTQMVTELFNLNYHLLTIPKAIFSLVLPDNLVRAFNARLTEFLNTFSWGEYFYQKSVFPVIEALHDVFPLKEERAKDMDYLKSSAERFEKNPNLAMYF